MQLSNKIKGIFRVSSANFWGLGVTMLTSLVLPLAISVSEYGYWQLFSLYLSYVGFFVLGFNDGIHLNYADCDYNGEFQSKFKTFFLHLSILGVIETLILIAAVFIISKEDTNRYLLYLVALNLLPVSLSGLFIYMNQGTLRFKEYSFLTIFDKTIFAILLVILLCVGVKKAIYYIIIYTLMRYLSLVYIYISTKDVFKARALPFNSLRTEIVNNYKKGFPLMIAGILGGPTLIVGGRMLVENRFGIEAFSAYSFSLNTIVIAAQFISAVSTVFYPILKRTSKEELPVMYNSFDKITTLFSVFLLLTYFPAALLVNILYVKYSSILAYLYIVYPLFIYQCKSNVLIVNAYKVKSEPTRLIIINVIGIAIHVLCIAIAYLSFHSVLSIAIATLLSLAIWYYLIHIHMNRKEGWLIRGWIFMDAIFVALFVLLNYVLTIVVEDVNVRIIAGFLIMAILCTIVCLAKKAKVRSMIKEFVGLMKD